MADREDDVAERIEGVVVSQQANFFYVNAGGTEIACHMRGRLKKAGETPLVGDRVHAVLEPLNPDEPLPPPRKGSLMLAHAALRGVRRGFIDAIAPRKHVLERPAIANVDRNWSPVDGEFARLTRTSDPMRAIITSAINFMPTENA